MKVKTRGLRVTLSAREARLLYLILGRFDIETCAQLLEGAEHEFGKLDITSADDLDRETDRIYQPLVHVFEYGEAS